MTGPEWLTGGKFGAEASVVAVALCTAAGVALAAYAYRHGSWIPPFWRRSRRVVSPGGSAGPLPAQPFPRSPNAGDARSGVVGER